jgi:PAS domain-containing protein
LGILIIEDITHLKYSLEITKLKKIEAANRETEQRYREIIENAHDIILSTRPDGTLGK